ncbi:MAG TPA: DUF1206 domain-containing protein [Streptosporangiaceae bacterium]|nr:DUF1206 domain-containing protein [Streptosporangiaceae bacterium]
MKDTQPHTGGPAGYDPARDGKEQEASRTGTYHSGSEATPVVPDAAGTAKRAGRRARSAGREAASSRWMRGLARGGLVARGVNYLLIGSLAVQIAFGSGGKQADTTGALRAVADHPGGIAVLWLLAAGFAGLALWRFAETAYGQADPAGRAAPKRLASLALGVLYGCICGIMVNFILGTGGSTTSNTESRSFTARLLAHSGGQVLVAAIGVAVAAVGVGIGIYGLRRQFATYLRKAQMSAPARKVVEGLGIAGYLARGAVFCVAGAFLVDAAASFNPQKAQGLDGSLRKTAATPLGPWLLLIVALGLVIFGLYSWCEARWREVEPS